MLKFIERFLQKKLDKKKSDVIRLRWELAQQQQKLDDLKRQKGNNDGRNKN